MMWFYILLLLIFGGIFNKKIRFYLQISAACICASAVAVCSIPFVDFKNKTSKNGFVTASAILFCFRYILGVKYNISGLENVSQNTGAIILMNHQSLFDVGALSQMVVNVENVAYVAKKKVFYMWPFGYVIWLMGTIFIDKKKGDPRHEVNQTAGAIKERKVKVFFFPEGTRNSKDQLLPFKKGGFHLAIAAQCPIIPIVVSKSRHFTDKSFEQKAIQFSILPPISTKGLTTDDVTKLSQDTRDLMQVKFDDLNKAIQS